MLRLRNGRLACVGAGHGAQEALLNCVSAKDVQLAAYACGVGSSEASWPTAGAHEAIALFAKWHPLTGAALGSWGAVRGRSPHPAGLLRHAGSPSGTPDGAERRLALGALQRAALGVGGQRPTAHTQHLRMCPWALSDAAEELDVGALDCLRPAPEAMDTDTGPRSVTAQSHSRLPEAEALYKALRPRAAEADLPRWRGGAHGHGLQALRAGEALDPMVPHLEAPEGLRAATPLPEAHAAPGAPPPGRLWIYFLYTL